MELPFESIAELFEYFKDEKTCLEYFEQQQWGGKPICPFCGHNRSYKVTGRGYKCANNKCYKHYTVKVGTIFENSKVPMRKWFAAIYLSTINKKGVSAMQLQRYIKVSLKTAWFMLHRIRHAVVEVQPELLTGIVECDESWSGGKNKNRHLKDRKAKTQSCWDKTAIMGIYQRGGNIILRVLPNTFQDSMLNVLLKHISPDAFLVTDTHSSYQALHKIHPNHIMVKGRNDGRDYYVKFGVFHTNNIEGFWALLKRGIMGVYHYISPQHLQRYCDEYAFRHNTRNLADNERFHLSLVKTAGRRLRYKDLIKDKDPRW